MVLALMSGKDPMTMPSLDAILRLNLLELTMQFVCANSDAPTERRRSRTDPQWKRLSDSSQVVPTNDRLRIELPNWRWRWR